MSWRTLLFRRPSEPQLRSEPQAIEVAFDGAIHVVRLRRHRQARRYTLRIDGAARDVVLTMPPRGSIKDARTFAQKHGAWIAARLKRLPSAIAFVPGAELPLRGVGHRVVHRDGARGTVWTEYDEGDALLCVAGALPHVARRVGDFLKREAKLDLSAASHRHAATLGVTIKRIAVRDQASRWGSCSNSGALSYSWRLILAPPFVLDYLAAHEVAHLVELNHSTRFWRLAHRLSPDVDRAKAWLDVHGAELHRYGTSQ